MANKNGHGGYRQPSNPAPVSGPGKLSRRTDGKQPIMDRPAQNYGDRQDLHNIQASAPMYQAGGPALSPAASPGAADVTQMPTSIGAPTSMPNEPVTSGANAGPGPDLSSLNLPNQGDSVESLRAMYGPILPSLIRESQSPYATQSFKDAVRILVSLM